MRIAISADHAGWELKERLRAELERRKEQVIDHGTSSSDSVDYPVFAHRVAEAVGGGEADRGVLVCGTGVGMAMSANRHPGVRAVNCTEAYTVRMARAHNDANVLTLGARVIGDGVALELLHTFLDTAFEGGRHDRRVQKIELANRR